MEKTTIEQPEKTRVVVTLDPRVARRLKRERAETDRPVNEIVERIVADHFGLMLDKTS